MDNSSITQIRDVIKTKYNRVAMSAEGIFNYPTGRKGLEFLSYNEDFYEKIPEQITESFCGVGNPFSLGDIQPGDKVLDIGSGAGFDVIFASQIVDSKGVVEGIDLTPEMVHKAQSNIQLLEISNVNVQEGTAESIPFSEQSFDVVISNGVINLSPQKELVFDEIFRVLKPGGRLQFADIILEESYTNLPSSDLEAWSN